MGLALYKFNVHSNKIYAVIVSVSVHFSLLIQLGCLKSISWIIIFSVHKEYRSLEDQRINFWLGQSLFLFGQTTKAFTSFSMTDWCVVSVSPQDGAVE